MDGVVGVEDKGDDMVVFGVGGCEVELERVEAVFWSSVGHGEYEVDCEREKELFEARPCQECGDNFAKDEDELEKLQHLGRSPDDLRCKLHKRGHLVFSAEHHAQRQGEVRVPGADHGGGRELDLGRSVHQVRSWRRTVLGESLLHPLQIRI